jgi:hypothetical protein
MNCRPRPCAEDNGLAGTLSHHEHHQLPRAPESSPSHHTASALFRFQFQKSYSGLYSNKQASFVLREEHVAELKRLVNEYHQARTGRFGPLSMSDIVNSALDFALEHPVAFQYSVAPEDLRETLAKEIYRRAFLHFLCQEVL